MENPNIFDPVLNSEEENAFLLEAVGQPPVVALKQVPPGVNPNQVRPILERVYELQELEKHAGEKWVGVEAIKAAIKTYQEQSAKWAADNRRGRPRFPSLYSFDSRGRAHRYGPGSDSGRVRTYFTDKGERKPFAVELIPSEVAEWAPDWIQAVAQADEPGDGLTVNYDKNRIECFCGHTEQFKAESRGSYNAARARMSKHLRSATEEAARHREVHTAVFGG